MHCNLFCNREKTKWNENDWKAHSVQINRLSTPRKVTTENYPVGNNRITDKIGLFATSLLSFSGEPYQIV